MSCPQCPHCQSGVEKGGKVLPVSSGNEKQPEEKKETPKSPARGKAREYTQAFETAWKAYGRKDEKFEAFGAWLVRSKELGGETLLVTLILGALRWQGPTWAADGWKFAPYFERYLKRRKWEDERPPVPVRLAQPQRADGMVAATERKVAEYRAAQARTVTPADLAAIAELRRAAK